MEVSGLLAAADIADAVGEKATAEYLRETADNWNDNIERWTYASNTDLARQIGVEGYYVRKYRAAGNGLRRRDLQVDGFVPIKNRPPGLRHGASNSFNQSRCIGHMVRFGLRAPDDPRMPEYDQGIIDALLQVKLPQGPCWYRYNDDGYGEHEDGSPFDGTGIGRPWPLLAERTRPLRDRAAGRPAVAEELLRVMEFSTEGGRLIPEQQSGMLPTCRSENCSKESPLVRPVRWCGRISGVHQAAALAAGRRESLRSTATDCATVFGRERTNRPTLPGD